jgi:hypothetical protein
MKKFDLVQRSGKDRELEARLKLEPNEDGTVPMLTLDVSHYAPSKAYTVRIYRALQDGIFETSSYMLFGGNQTPFAQPDKRIPAPRYSAKKLQELFDAELEALLNSPELEAGLDWAADQKKGF